MDLQLPRGIAVVDAGKTNTKIVLFGPDGRPVAERKVEGLIETGGNDVLCVRADDGKEHLLPFVGAVILDVDLAAKRIRVEWEKNW